MVLNQAPLASYIPESTKQRIIHVAEGLGYEPNPFARALRSHRSHTIGVMVPDIADPYCAQILRGIENSFSRSSYLPFLVDIQNDPLRFKKYLNVLLGRRVEDAVLHELLLQAQACGVIDGTELDDGDQIGFATELRRSRSKPLTVGDTEKIHGSCASLRMTNCL